MTTIGSSTTIGITLTSATYTNPVVVDPGVTISNPSGKGIYANSATGYWTIQNNGTISGAGSGGSGIDLLGGGSVTNAAGALIAGYEEGVFVPFNQQGNVLNYGTIGQPISLVRV